MIKVFLVFFLFPILILGQSLKDIDINPWEVDDLSEKQIELLVDKISKYRYELKMNSLPNSVTKILYDRRPELTQKINQEIKKGKLKYQNSLKTSNRKSTKILYTRAELEKTGLKKKVVKNIMKDFKGDIKKALINYSYNLKKNFPEVYSAARKLGFQQSKIIEYKNGYNKRLAARRAKRASTWTAIAAGVAQGAASYSNSYSSNNTQKSTYVASPSTSRQYLKSQGQLAPSSSKNPYTSIDFNTNDETDSFINEVYNNDYSANEQQIKPVSAQGVYESVYGNSDSNSGNDYSNDIPNPVFGNSTGFQNGIQNSSSQTDITGMTTNYNNGGVTSYSKTDSGGRTNTNAISGEQTRDKFLSNGDIEHLRDGIPYGYSKKARGGYEYYEGGIYKGMWKQNSNGYYELFDSGGMSTGRIIKFN